MKNNLTEHVQSIGKEFDEKMSEIISYIPTQSHSKDGESLLRYVDVQNETGLKVMKLFFLSQLKTIELVKEELEGMKILPEINLKDGYQRDDMLKMKEHDKTLSQTITLLDTIIQKIKSQIK